MNRIDEIRERYEAGISVRAAAEELGMRRTDVAAAYREMRGGSARKARLTGAERREVQIACSARRALGPGVDEIAGYSTDCGMEVGRCYNELSHLPDGTPFLVGGYQTERGREVLGLDGRTESPKRRDWERASSASSGHLPTHPASRPPSLKGKKTSTPPRSARTAPSPSSDQEGKERQAV